VISQHYAVNILNSTLVIISSLLSGCVLLDLRDDLILLDESSNISGKLESNSVEDKPVLIALYKPDENETYTLETFTVRYGTGNFELLVGNGDYYLVAFEDSNEDFTWQENERIGWHGDPTLLHAKNGKDYVDLNLSLRSPEQAKQELPVLFSPSIPKEPLKIEETQVGIVTTYDDKRFNAEVGMLGMWQPFEFVQQDNHGIFFLEPYDPNKIPILFVHGLTGSGGDWRTVIKNLDREQFQPWILQYPSGLHLSLVGRVASEGITKLKLRYKFKKLYVVAHSVGGLVSRSLINHHIQQTNHSNIEMFVSISAPWEGHSVAGSGAKNAPVVAPSWYDIAPNSPFLTSLTQEPLPSNIEFDLLFSYRAPRLIDNAIHQSNSDGSVTVKTQLPIKLQNQAKYVLGFNESHKTILKSEQMIEHLNMILHRVYSAQP